MKELEEGKEADVAARLKEHINRNKAAHTKLSSTGTLPVRFSKPQVQAAQPSDDLKTAQAECLCYLRSRPLNG